MPDFSASATAGRVPMEADRRPTEEAPEASNWNENVFPEMSLTSATLESDTVAQTEIDPTTLAVMPLLEDGFLWVVART